MRVEVVGPSIPDGRARQAAGITVVVAHRLRSTLRPQFLDPSRNGCEVGLSCPAKLLAAKILTVSGLQCQASLRCCMTALQMFMGLASSDVEFLAGSGPNNGYDYT